jgi:large subunit ribosomal protein L15
MKLHELKPDPGSRKKGRRLGRGISAGQGKTAGRGTKGQKSRPGGGKGPYFEGGQLPLVRRLPFKRGFTNPFRIEYEEVSLKKLAETFTRAGDVTPEKLAEKGLIKDAEKPVVILGGEAELKTKLNVSAHRFTTSAKNAIEGAGGTTTIIPLAVTGARATVKKLKKEQQAKAK